MRSSFRFRSWVGCIALVAWACDAPGTGGNGDPHEDPPCAGYEAAGPFASGVVALEMDGLPVEVWYPADPDAVSGPKAEYDMRDWLPEDEREKVPDEAPTRFEMNAWRDAPASGSGPFPVVLFSHGLAGYRMQSSFLATHLASWGFVVASPEHPERNLPHILEGGFPGGEDAPEQLRAVLDLLLAENVRSGGPLEGRIDEDRVGLAGHSAGGGTVRAIADDPAFSTWITYATGGNAAGPEKPALIMDGTHDELVTPETVRTAYDRQPAPKRYVSIDAAGHLAFADICVIGREEGGMLQIAMDHGIEVPFLVQVLAEDGCREGDLPAEEAWPVVGHFTLAHLREVFAIDAPPVGLDAEVTACFGNRIADYRYE